MSERLADIKAALQNQNVIDRGGMVVYADIRWLVAEVERLERELAEAQHALFHSQKDTIAARGDRDRFQAERDAARAELAEARVQLRGECDAHVGDIEELSATINTLEHDLAAAREKYNELLYAVVNKYPGEDRHATALRQLTEANTPSGESSAAMARREP